MRFFGMCIYIFITLKKYNCITCINNKLKNRKIIQLKTYNVKIVLKIM